MLDIQTNHWIEITFIEVSISSRLYSQTGYEVVYILDNIILKVIL
jgi:hypothetical protein